MSIDGATITPTLYPTCECRRLAADGALSDQRTRSSRELEELGFHLRDASAKLELVPGDGRRVSPAARLPSVHDLLDALAQTHDAAQTAAAAGDPDQAIAHVAEALELVAQLRRLEPRESPVSTQAAQDTLALATDLARQDGPRYLSVLVAATESFARACQRNRRFEPAVEAFERAVEGAKLLALSGGPEQQLALTELISAQALCLAQSGRLEPALAATCRVVELARPQLWQSLPLVTGSLAFASELALDLGNMDAARAYLVEALELLDSAAAAELPGVPDAVEKLSAKLAELPRP